MRKLTDRQKQVIKCISEGMNTKEAGGHLGLSGRTIDRYLTVIRQKTDAKTTANAVYKVTKAGII